MVLALLAEAVAGQSSVDRQPQLSVVTAGTYCLVEKLKGIGSSPPRFENGKYKVKGILQSYSGPVGNIEIFLLFYGQHDQFAVLYSSFLRDEKNGLRVYIGQWSTFKSQHGRLEPDELPGGLATQKQEIETFRRVQMQMPLFLDVDAVQAAKPVCIWQP